MGPEFGSKLEGYILIIVKALYSLCTSAARFHEHLADTLRNRGFRQFCADYNFWICDQGKCYNYLASFVDDVLVSSKDLMVVIDALKTCTP